MVNGVAHVCLSGSLTGLLQRRGCPRSFKRRGRSGLSFLGEDDRGNMCGGMSIFRVLRPYFNRCCCTLSSISAGARELEPPPLGASVRSPGAQRGPKQAPPPPGPHSCIWRAPPIELWGPMFNIQEKITVHFHTQCAVCTMQNAHVGAYV